jgi:hypothetical protein
MYGMGRIPERKSKKEKRRSKKCGCGAKRRFRRYGEAPESVLPGALPFA